MLQNLKILEKLSGLFEARKTKIVTSNLKNTDFSINNLLAVNNITHLADEINTPIENKTNFFNNMSLSDLTGDDLSIQSEINNIKIKDNTNILSAKVENNLDTSEANPSSQLIYKSPLDFTATYISNSSILLSGHPVIFNSTEINYIKIISSTGNINMYVNGSNGITFTYSSNIISIDGASPFTSEDMYEVGLFLQKKPYNNILDITKTLNQYTSLVTFSNIGFVNDIWIDQGSEIDCRGYKTIGVYINLIANNSTGNQMQILSKYESGGTDRYLPEPINNYKKDLGNSNKKVLYRFNVESILYVQIQTKAANISVGKGIKGTVSIAIIKDH